MVVIDASALVELVIGATPLGTRIATRVASPTETLHAPHHVDLEALSALRSLEARGTIHATVAARAISDLISVALTKYEHVPLLPRIWALRGHLSVYDASYIALAEQLSAPLVTCDAKLAAAPGHRARIELFA